MPSPDAQPEVVVYSTPMCIPCDELKQHLAAHDVPFTLVDVLIDEDAAEMLEDAGIDSSPALAIGGELDGVRLLSPEAIDRARVEQSNGIDAVVGIPLRFGLGFRLPLPDVSWGPGALGHSGAGGSAGFADPEARLSFGYAMNQMLALDDPRANRLAEAVYGSL